MTDLAVEPQTQDQKQPGATQPPQQPFQMPDASFARQIAAEMPTSGNRLEIEEWLKRAEAAVQTYYTIVDVERLKHAAAQGQMAQFIEEDRIKNAGLDDAARLEKVSQSMQWSDQRNPQVRDDFDRTLSPFLTHADPNIQKEASGLSAFRDDITAFRGTHESDLAAIRKRAKDLVKGEADRHIQGIAKEAWAGTFFQTAGGPEERVQAALLEDVERRTEAWRQTRDRSPSKERFEKDKIADPEDYRRFLRTASTMAAAQEMKGTDISESWLEGAARKAAGFVGLPVAGAIGSAIKGAGKLVGLGKAASKILEVGGIGSFIYTTSRTGVPGVPDPQRLATADEPPEVREKAEHARALGNAIIGTTMLPVFRLAGVVGQKVKGTAGGIGKALAGTAASAGAMTGGMEAHGAVGDWMLKVIDSASEEGGAIQKQVDLHILTHPRAAGHIESIFKAESPEAAWAAATELAKEFSAGMLFFGAANAVHAAKPHLLRPKQWLMAKKEVLANKDIPGETKGMLLKHLDSIKPEPTAKEKLEGERGEEQAAKDIAGELERQDAERMRRMAGERPAEAREVADKRAADERRQAEHEALSSRGREAEDEIRLESNRPRGDQSERPTDAPIEDAAAYRKMAETAEGEERVKLSDAAAAKEKQVEAMGKGEEPKPVAEGLAEAAETRQERAIQEMTEAPAKAEEAAKTLLEGGLERQELQARADKLDQATNRKLSDKDRKLSREEVDTIHRRMDDLETDLEGGKPRVDVHSAARNLADTPHFGQTAPYVSSVVRRVIEKYQSFERGGALDRGALERLRSTLTRAESESGESLPELVKPGDIVETPRGEVVIDSVSPTDVTGTTKNGESWGRTAKEFVGEGNKLVGKKKKAPKAKDLTAKPADGKKEAPEARERRIKALAQKAARMRQDTPERQETVKQINEEVAEYDSQLAQDTYKARKAASGDPDTPPPGEDVVPPEMMAGIRIFKDAQGSGLLERLAKSKNWATLEPEAGDSAAVRSVLETAKRRGMFYPSSLKGQDRAIQAMYDHLRDAEGLPYPAESFKASISRLNHDLGIAAKKSGPELAQALQAILERHHDFIKGPWGAVTRFSTDGISALNRMEQLVAEFYSNAKEIAKNPAEAGMVATPSGAEAVEAGGRLVRMLRSVWPWSTTHGFNPNIYTMSPRAQNALVDELLRAFQADPEANYTGVLDSAMKRMGINWGMPEIRYGRIGVEATKMLARVEIEIKEHLRGLVDKKTGLLSNLTPEQRKEIYLWAQKDAETWKDIKDPVVAERVPKVREINDRFRDALWESSPTNYHLSERSNLLNKFAARAEANLANKEPGTRAHSYAKKLASDARIRVRQNEDLIAERKRAWAQKNFVHHVSSLKPITHGDYNILKRRKPEDVVKVSEHKPLEDIVASMVDYGSHAVSLIHRQNFFRDNDAFLYGRERPIEWSEIAESNWKQAFLGDRDVAVVGEFYVHEKGRFTDLVKTRRKVGDEWQDVTPPPGAKRKIVVTDYHDKRLYDFSRTTDMVEQRLSDPLDKSVALLTPDEAMLSLSINDGGWFQRAQPDMAKGMDAYLAKAKTGLDELRLNQNVAQGLAAQIGRFSSRIKMVGIGSPMNIAMQASLMNSLHMAPPTQLWATKQFGKFMRRLATRDRGEIAPGARVGSADYEKGRSFIRSTPEELMKLSPKDAGEQVIADDAMVNMLGSGMFEHTFLDLANELNLPKGADVKVEDVRKATRMFKGWDWPLMGVRGADAFGRIQNYMGVYRNSVEGGYTRAQAHDRAMNAVMFNHGIFNAMSANPLLGSWVGQFFLGLKTYVARQMFVFAQAPPEYKIKYASMALATNYLWQQVGFGDLTSSLGTNGYELFGELAEDIFLGGEEPLGPDTIVRPGFLPVPTPFGRSPMITASGKWIDAAKDFAKGNAAGGVDDLWRGVVDAFAPPMLDTIFRSQAKPGPEGTFQAIPLASRLTGEDKTSYTLRQSGIAQVAREFVPGTQMDAQIAMENRRIDEAQKRRLESQRQAVHGSIRGLLRRHDEAQATGGITETHQKETQKQWAETMEAGRRVGINLSDQTVRQQAIRQARERIAVDQLPSELRPIVSAPSKEAQVKLLTNALDRGIAKERLNTLAGTVAGKKGLMTWALDRERVSTETASRFREAVAKWQAKQSAASEPRAVAR